MTKALRAATEAAAMRTGLKYIDIEAQNRHLALRQLDDSVSLCGIVCASTIIRLQATWIYSPITPESANTGALPNRVDYSQNLSQQQICELT